MNRKAMLIGIATIFFAIVVGGIWLSGKLPLSGAAATTSQLNLLQDGWGYTPGVVPQADGLHVAYLGRAIVQKDGSPGQQNPAVNLYGTHFHATKDFTLSATLKDIKGIASLRLYADAPLVQDEFRIDPKGLGIAFDGPTVTLTSWGDYKNQKLLQQKPTKTETFSMTPQATTTLDLQRSGNQLAVLINGKKVTTVPYSSVFNQDIWFGLTAVNPGDSWTLATLSAEPPSGSGVSAINTQNLAVNPTEKTSALQLMAQAKRPDFLIGAAVALTPSVADERYRNLVYGGNFGMITTENVLKWQFIHPQPALYDFKEADALVDMARKNNLRVQGHTLVFGEANPKWVQDLPTTTAADKAAIKQVMIDHITQTMAHFKGRVAAWDVVNEPLADDVSGGATFRTHKWFEAMGEDYIATALQAARQADPNAKLYINDFGLEEDGDRWNAMLALVTKLKSENVPLDGIGFEGHVYASGDEIDPVVLRSHIRALAAIGVTSHISEMDVHNDNGTTAQAKQYADVLNACIQEPSCTSWATWGVTDRYDVFSTDSGTLGHGQDFLWDMQSNPTPAVSQIQNILRQ